MKYKLLFLFLLVNAVGFGQINDGGRTSDPITDKTPYIKNGHDSIVFDGSNYKLQPDISKLKYCSCDSLKLSWGIDFYNKDRQIAKCGYFNNYRMTYGLKFIYSDERKLIKIEKYYNGQVVGECKIK